MKLCKICDCNNVVTKKNNVYCDDCIKAGTYRRKTDITLIKSDRHRRFLLIETFGHRCMNCGNSEWMGKPIPLELHHVDGKADNNTLENLQLLCLNCHALTPTFRARNKGNCTRNK